MGGWGSRNPQWGVIENTVLVDAVGRSRYAGWSLSLFDRVDSGLSSSSLVRLI
jgi:hypothetical protein